MSKLNAEVKRHHGMDSDDNHDYLCFYNEDAHKVSKLIKLTDKLPLFF